jgi:hypothetical protein
MLEEAQVLLGNRVWLPFARARHYMRSRQSLLDSSLTGFYLVAERHRGCPWGGPCFSFVSCA